MYVNLEVQKQNTDMAAAGVGGGQGALQLSGPTPHFINEETEKD